MKADFWETWPGIVITFIVVLLVISYYITSNVILLIIASVIILVGVVLSTAKCWHKWSYPLQLGWDELRAIGLFDDGLTLIRCCRKCDKVQYVPLVREPFFPWRTLDKIEARLRIRRIKRILTLGFENIDQDKVPITKTEYSDEIEAGLYEAMAIYKKVAGEEWLESEKDD